jgi:hypothetical protein
MTILVFGVPAVRRLDGVTSIAAAGPQRLRPPSRCASTGGWSCSGALRAGRRSTLERRGSGHGAASWCRAVSGQTQPAVSAANASSTWAWITPCGRHGRHRTEPRYTHLERPRVENPHAGRWVTHGAWPESMWSSPGASSRVAMAMTAAGRLQGGKRRSGPRLRVDGRVGQSRLNMCSPMLNAQRSTTPQREPGMAGAEEPPLHGSCRPAYRQAEQTDSASTVSPAPPTGRISLCLRPAAEGEEMRRTLYRFRYLVLGVVLAAIVGQIAFGYSTATRQLNVSGGGIALPTSWSQPTSRPEPTAGTSTQMRTRTR